MQIKNENKTLKKIVTTRSMEADAVSHFDWAGFTVRVRWAVAVASLDTI